MFNDRKMREQQLALEAVELLRHDEQKAWHSSLATCRAMCYVGKELVVYKTQDGQALLVDSLRCVDVGMSAHDGISSHWHSDMLGGLIVDHKPLQIYEGIFLWHTYLSEVQFVPVNQKPTVRFSLLFKCSEHPRDLVPDVLYIQEKNRVIIGASK